MGEWMDLLQNQRNTMDFPFPEQEQLKKYAEAYRSLSALFQEMPCQRQRLTDRSLQNMIQDVREQVCRRCGRNRTCLGEAYPDSTRMLMELSEEVQTEGISADRIRQYSGACAHAAEVAEIMEESCAHAQAELLWHNRILELRTAVGEQIRQTADILGQMSESICETEGPGEASRKKLRKNLSYLNIRMEGLRVFRCAGGRLEYYLTLYTVRGACVSARTVAEVLSDACASGYTPARNCPAAVSGKKEIFHFVPDTRYRLSCGVSRITRDGEQISGDNYSFLETDSGQVVMSLADGMGSGLKACRESTRVIELLEQFLDAGFSHETAIRLMNSCMLLQNEEQIFSTVDLCMIDLYRASCDMVKSGAAATFLLHGDHIEMIRSDTVPGGLLWQSDYRSVRRKLRSGDVIVMMTDGVLDAIPEEQQEPVMAELLKKSAAPGARDYARRLMERIYVMEELHARDDMTVMVGCIRKK